MPFGTEILRRQHDAAAGAEHHAPGVHQLAQGVAEIVVLMLLGEAHFLGQPPRFQRTVLLGFEVRENLCA